MNRSVEKTVEVHKSLLIESKEKKNRVETPEDEIHVSIEDDVFGNKPTHKV